MTSRWTVLFIVCFGMFAYNYCYDNPVALQKQLQETYDLNDVKYALLYSVYAFPNALIPFCGGILTDIFGANTTIIMFFIFILIGHGLFTIGCMISNNNFLVMIIGRFLFGVGSESYSFVTIPLLYKYFKNKELAFSLALTLSFARIGSCSNDYLTYFVYKRSDNIALAVSIGFWILMLSFIALLGLTCYRINFESNIYDKIPLTSIPTTPSSPPSPTTSTEEEGSTDNIQPFGTNIEQITSINNEEQAPNNNECDDPSICDDPSLCDIEYDEEVIESNDTFHLSDIKEFDFCYWLLVLNCGVLYGAFYPFMNIAGDFVQNTYNLSNEKANMLLMIPYIIGSVATMIVGYIIDRKGKGAYCLLIAAILLVISHSIFIGCIVMKKYDIYYVIIALTVLGIEFSIFSAVIWPLFANLVKEKCLGTAYGVPTSFYNLTCSVFYIFVGMLTKEDGTNNNDDDKYLNVEYFLLASSVFGVLSVLLLLYIDHKTGNRLNIAYIKT